MKKTVLKDLVKASKPPKIVAFMPFNASADTQKIKFYLFFMKLSKIRTILDHKSNKLSSQKLKPQELSIQIKSHMFFPILTCKPRLINVFMPNFKMKCVIFKLVSELSKENYIFVACDRDFQSCLDFAKIADIICPVLSCKDCVIDGLIKDPHSNARSFDDEGYKLLTSLRIQGISKMAGIIQDLEVIPAAKQPLVNFLQINEIL